MFLWSFGALILLPRCPSNMSATAPLDSSAPRRHVLEGTGWVGWGLRPREHEKLMLQLEGICWVLKRVLLALLGLIPKGPKYLNVYQ